MAVHDRSSSNVVAFPLVRDDRAREEAEALVAEAAGERADMEPLSAEAALPAVALAARFALSRLLAHRSYADLRDGPQGEALRAVALLCAAAERSIVGGPVDYSVRRAIGDACYVVARRGGPEVRRVQRLLDGSLRHWRDGKRESAETCSDRELRILGKVVATS